MHKSHGAYLLRLSPCLDYDIVSSASRTAGRLLRRKLKLKCHVGDWCGVPLWGSSHDAVFMDGEKLSSVQ